MARRRERGVGGLHPRRRVAEARRRQSQAFSTFDLMAVDEAGMVSNDHWRCLLAHTTAAGTKTVLFGEAHQLATVRLAGFNPSIR